MSDRGETRLRHRRRRPRPHRDQEPHASTASSVDCYERETGVGGAWNWRHDRSPVYASTHLISSKPFTQFPDFPMPDTGRTTRTTARCWPTSSATPTTSGCASTSGSAPRWSGSSRPTSRTAWDVTIRGARRRRPNAPCATPPWSWPTGTTGRRSCPRTRGSTTSGATCIHASAYKDAAQLRGRRVLVVGAGNTGCDIAVEAAQQAARCWHSSRRGYWYAPKYAFGRPADQVNDRVLGAAAAAAAAAVAVPPHAAADRRRPHPVRPARARPQGLRDAPDRQQPARVLRRPRRHHAGARRRPVHRNAVEFTDGRTAEPDLVVLATGYLPRFEFLAPELLGVDDDGPAAPATCTLFSPRATRRWPSSACSSPTAASSRSMHWQTVTVGRPGCGCASRRPSGPPSFWARRRSQAGPAGTTAAKVKESTRHWFEVSHVDYLRALQRTLRRPGGGSVTGACGTGSCGRGSGPTRSRRSAARCSPSHARTARRAAGRRCCSCPASGTARGRSPSTGCRIPQPTWRPRSPDRDGGAPPDDRRSGRDRQRQRRGLLHHVVRAAEDERTRIAHDVHDDPVQKLIAVKMQLEMLGSAHPELPEVMEAQATVASTIDSMRRMLFDLSPPILDEGPRDRPGAPVLPGALAGHDGVVAGRPAALTAIHADAADPCTASRKKRSTNARKHGTGEGQGHAGGTGRRRVDGDHGLRATASSRRRRSLTPGHLGPGGHARTG